ncbi:hypothetical protein KDU71_11790 [Carboxylicivirga sediminis]|uniref:Uncharacterized protein n=1 Tax=Carboxylicivirga sediminis TaxID=2006564 RepID=A0A941F4E9_9BACT|nr:hypothetical protein [Carboxylicivirga sediminis]MBR8536242.1 hypothetical protein [Carboxylicivirga sediminis]
MDDLSIKRGYLPGILISFGLLLIGYFLNPVLSTLGIAQLVWPQNLYFILLVAAIGLAVGIISDSEKVKFIGSKEILLPICIVAVFLGIQILIRPDGFEVSFVNRLRAVPAMLLAICAFFAGGVFIGLNSRQFKAKWSSLLIVIATLVFVFSTVVGQHDYYNLSMRTGADRALFEAEAESGKFYRLPFAVKLLGNEGVDESVISESGEIKVRFFDTVSEYTDVVMGTDDVYNLKGWVVKRINTPVISEDSAELIDLSLVFDRWVELKYISLGLLLLSLGLKIKF